MPGAIFECTVCKKEIRSGYPSYAIQFAASKRGISEAEIIEDFFEFNKKILRKEPQKCPNCGAGKAALKKIGEID
ncbi:MAG: hypothetical protein HYW50_01580 [Candidatus Diapherotrites archaeon]|nr:hypothetical protein [Candidatus Diapherotrites archaeon]